MDAPAKPTTDEILKVEDVTVAFGAFKALTKLTFSMARGELRVVIGPNGAGKTTLLDVISGKTRPVSGHAPFQPAGSPRIDATTSRSRRSPAWAWAGNLRRPTSSKS